MLTFDRTDGDTMIVRIEGVWTIGDPLEPDGMVEEELSSGSPGKQRPLVGMVGKSVGLGAPFSVPSGWRGKGGSGDGEIDPPPKQNGRPGGNSLLD